MNFQQPAQYPIIYGGLCDGPSQFVQNLVSSMRVEGLDPPRPKTFLTNPSQKGWLSDMARAPILSVLPPHPPPAPVLPPLPLPPHHPAPTPVPPSPALAPCGNLPFNLEALRSNVKIPFGDLLQSPLQRPTKAPEIKLSKQRSFKSFNRNNNRNRNRHLIRFPVCLYLHYYYGDRLGIACLLFLL